jgi:hypothetical protein
LTERPIAPATILRANVSRSELLAVLACCTSLSLAAVVWSWRHAAMLNYGDAVAHLHIARRVFDSHQPRFSQLGSVWLPLPHLLLIPFVQVYSWWADGFAGVVPSALAYLAACAGIYRLARGWLPPSAAALALVFFALNPNLLYLQTTAMTEPLFLCEMIWIAVWLVEWQSSLNQNLNQKRTNSDPGSRNNDARRSARLLWFIAIALVAAIFTRYDGWVMALLAWTSIGLILVRRGRLRSRAFWLASVLVVAAPIAWFLYNSVTFGDWLFFLRGPYSAKAIETRTSAPGYPPHPGWHNPWVGLIFFVKAAEMDAAASAWGTLLLALSLTGTAFAWIIARRRAFVWALLFWLPVPFYAYSVAYGSVPIFLPVWWPHSWYNTRYGMELLPAFALGLGFVANFIIAAVREFKLRWALNASAVLFALVVLNAYQMLRERPLVYVEGTRNLQARRPIFIQIPPVLRALLAQRPGSLILMDTSVYPEIVTLTGIPLRQTINESDLGLYRDALSAPAAHAAIVLAFDGDQIDRAVHLHPQGLTAYRRLTAPGQPSATIYVTDTLPLQALNKQPGPVLASVKETP